MAVIKGIEKVVKGEGFDLGVLKVAVKTFNEAGLVEKKIKFVAVKAEVLATEFMVAVEAVPKEKEKEIPKDVLTLYNAYADVIDDKKVALTGTEQTPGKSKIESKPKAPKIREKNRCEVFADIMREGGGTRKEIIEEMTKRYKGSEKEADFQVTSYLRLMEAFGLVEVGDTSGKITLIDAG